MSDFEVATVLPRELRLDAPPTMPQARSYLFRQQSTLSTYASGSTLQINIPRLQRSYLKKDSFLRFNLTGQFNRSAPTNALAPGLNLDTAGAYSLFEKIEIFDYLGSTVLESISGIPQLVSTLLDMGSWPMIDQTNGAISMGLNPSGTLNGVTTNDTPGTFTAYTTGFQVPSSLGLSLVGLGETEGAATYQTFSAEFSIPLPSFLGALSDKFIPLHNGFTIVLTLADQFKPFVMNFDMSGDLSCAETNNFVLVRVGNQADYPNLNPTISWQISDVYLDCNILELGPIAESMILSSTQGSPMIVHTKSFRNYVGSVNPGSPEFILNMNINVASLTNVLWIQRYSTQLNDLAYPSVGHHTRNFLSSWSFQYGSTVLPQSTGIKSMNTTSGLFPSGVNKPTTANWIYDNYSSGYTEHFQHLLNSRPTDILKSRITRPYFNVDTGYTLNPTNGVVSYLDWSVAYPSEYSQFGTARFACGLGLELVEKKYGSMICGLNTNGMNTSIRAVFHPQYTDYVQNTTVDLWAEYDAFINISPGIATTVSF
jgi:hypothetical protein